MLILPIADDNEVKRIVALALKFNWPTPSPTQMEMRRWINLSREQCALPSTNMEDEDPGETFLSTAHMFRMDQLD